MSTTTKATVTAPPAPPRKNRLGRPRLLIVGCGDIGMRILSRVRDRFRVVALTSTPMRITELRAAGAIPIVGNLDHRRSLARLTALASRVIYLAPPPSTGDSDPRMRHLLATLSAVRTKLVYVSTTGVYGDHSGAWIDESTPPRPTTARAVRRRAAEQTLRAWQRRKHGDARRASILRAPGIYGHDRLPLERLRAGSPALAPDDDVYTNHIHADDLAWLCLTALWRSRAARAYNAVDDTEMKMGEYFDAVANTFGLTHPPRLPRAQLQVAVSPAMYSFMTESRRLRNTRIKRELRAHLKSPSVAAFLKKLQLR